MVLEKFFYHDRIRFAAISVHRQEMMHQPAVVGMLIGQRCRMQQWPRCSDRRTAVGHIADERMSLMCQMDADLVASAGVDAHPAGCRSQRLHVGEGPDVGARGFAAAADEQLYV